MNSFHKLIPIGYLIAIILIIYVLLPGASAYEGHIADPIQINLSKPENITIYRDKDIQLSLLAEYTVHGIVKGHKRYSDDLSPLSRYDVALAWGDLNKEEIDKSIRYSQNGRWYTFLAEADSQVDSQYISNHSSNIHLIHKDSTILDKISKIGKNDYIRLKGYLVNVHFENSPWETSLSRADTGNGACEIMYVTSVEFLD